MTETVTIDEYDRISGSAMMEVFGGGRSFGRTAWLNQSFSITIETRWEPDARFLTVPTSATCAYEGQSGIRTYEVAMDAFRQGMQMQSREIATTFGISPQLVGGISSHSQERPISECTLESISFDNYFTTKVDEQLAKQQMRNFFCKYPKALPVIRQAIEDGRIDGSTYGWRTNGETFDPDRTVGGACFIGWMAYAYQLPRARVLHVMRGPYQEMENYLGMLQDGVRCGDTPDTSPVLAEALRILDEVAEEQAGIELRKYRDRWAIEHLYNEVYGLTRAVLLEYPQVAPYYIRAAEQGLFYWLPYDQYLSPDKQSICAVGWIDYATGQDWRILQTHSVRVVALEHLFVEYKAMPGQTYRDHLVLKAMRDASLDFLREDATVAA